MLKTYKRSESIYIFTILTQRKLKKIKIFNIESEAQNTLDKKEFET